MKKLTITILVIAMFASTGFAACITWGYSGYHPNWTPYERLRMREWVIKKNITISTLKELKQSVKQKWPGIGGSRNLNAATIIVGNNGKVRVRLRHPEFRRHPVGGKK